MSNDDLFIFITKLLHYFSYFSSYFNFHTILIEKRTYMLNVNVEIYAKM